MSAVKTASLLKRLLIQLYADAVAESQFAIDWLEQATDLEIPDDLYQDRDYVNSTLYQVDNILEIMNQDLPDYEMFKKIKGWLEDMYQD